MWGDPKIEFLFQMMLSWQSSAGPMKRFWTTRPDRFRMWQKCDGADISNVLRRGSRCRKRSCLWIFQPIGNNVLKPGIPGLGSALFFREYKVPKFLRNWNDYFEIASAESYAMSNWIHSCVVHQMTTINSGLWFTFFMIHFMSSLKYILVYCHVENTPSQKEAAVHTHGQPWKKMDLKRMMMMTDIWPVTSCVLLLLLFLMCGYTQLEAATIS